MARIPPITTAILSKLSRPDPSFSYTATVIGGTGAVGSALVQELLASPFCQKVVTVGRRFAPELRGLDGSEKLSQHVVKMDALQAEALPLLLDVKPQVAFSTIGARDFNLAPMRDIIKVDVIYAAQFSAVCRAAGVRHMSMVSALPLASRQPRPLGLPPTIDDFPTAKLKAEEGILAQNFERTSIFHPSLLVSDRPAPVFFDRLLLSVWARLIRWTGANRREIHAVDVARAMRIDAEYGHQLKGAGTLEYEQMQALLALDVRTAGAPAPSAVPRDERSRWYLLRVLGWTDHHIESWRPDWTRKAQKTADVSVVSAPAFASMEALWNSFDSDKNGRLTRLECQSFVKQWLLQNNMSETYDEAAFDSEWKNIFGKKPEDEIAWAEFDQMLKKQIAAAAAGGTPQLTSKQ
eukprot:gnl/Spiro4/3399_TR1650_c0_g1_i1.p1 gnl/Spiro4/3399_TR1650_c0_g1~~gnl/Spiro4/3399_TR1650_c0_g1_i1.p1  ORF type:complete len:407 (-),score=85.33 gnl/Spiro4/3399_TR1650_c0_g1_i1:39-1259(-)